MKPRLACSALEDLAKKALAILLSTCLILVAPGPGCVQALTARIVATPARSVPLGAIGFSQVADPWKDALYGLSELMNTRAGMALVSDVDPALLHLKDLDYQSPAALSAVAPIVAQVLKGKPSKAAQEIFQQDLSRISEFEEWQQKALIKALSQARVKGAPEAKSQLEQLREDVESGKVDLDEATLALGQLRGFRIYGDDVERSRSRLREAVARKRIERIKGKAKFLLEDRLGAKLHPKVLEAFEGDKLDMRRYTEVGQGHLSYKFRNRARFPKDPPKGADLLEQSRHKSAVYTWAKPFIKEGIPEARVFQATVEEEMAPTGDARYTFGRLKAARELYHQAAEEGYAPAFLQLGRINDGVGLLRKNPQEALKWEAGAAALGLKKALPSIGRRLETLPLEEIQEAERDIAWSLARLLGKASEKEKEEQGYDEWRHFLAETFMHLLNLVGPHHRRTEDLNNKDLQSLIYRLGNLGIHNVESMYDYLIRPRPINWAGLKKLLLGIPQRTFLQKYWQRTKIFFNPKKAKNIEWVAWFGVSATIIALGLSVWFGGPWVSLFGVVVMTAALITNVQLPPPPGRYNFRLADLREHARQVGHTDVAAIYKKLQNLGYQHVKPAAEAIASGALSEPILRKIVSAGESNRFTVAVDILEAAKKALPRPEEESEATAKTDAPSQSVSTKKGSQLPKRVKVDQDSPTSMGLSIHFRKKNLSNEEMLDLLAPFGIEERHIWGWNNFGSHVTFFSDLKGKQEETAVVKTVLALTENQDNAIAYVRVSQKVADLITGGEPQVPARVVRKKAKKRRPPSQSGAVDRTPPTLTPMAEAFVRILQPEAKPLLGDLTALISEYAQLWKITEVTPEKVIALLNQALEKPSVKERARSEARRGHMETLVHLSGRQDGGRSALNWENSMADQQMKSLRSSINDPKTMERAKIEVNLRRPTDFAEPTGPHRIKAPSLTPDRKEALVANSFRLNLGKLISNFDWLGFNGREEKLQRKDQLKYEGKDGPKFTLGHEIRRAALRAKREGRPLRVLEITDGLGVASLMFHGTYLSSFGDWLRSYKEEGLPIETMTVSPVDLLKPYLRGELKQQPDFGTLRNYLSSPLGLSDRKEDYEPNNLVSKLEEMAKSGKVQRRFGEINAALEILRKQGVKFDLILDSGGLAASLDRIRTLEQAQNLLVSDGAAFFPTRMWFETYPDGVKEEEYIKDQVSHRGQTLTLGEFLEQVAPEGFMNSDLSAGAQAIGILGTDKPLRLPKVDEVQVMFEPNDLGYATIKWRSATDSGEKSPEKAPIKKGAVFVSYNEGGEIITERLPGGMPSKIKWGFRLYGLETVGLLLLAAAFFASLFGLFGGFGTFLLVWVLSSLGVGAMTLPDELNRDDVRMTSVFRSTKEVGRAYSREREARRDFFLPTLHGSLAFKVTLPPDIRIYHYESFGHNTITPIGGWKRRQAARNDLRSLQIEELFYEGGDVWLERMHGLEAVGRQPMPLTEAQREGLLKIAQQETDSKIRDLANNVLENPPSYEKLDDTMKDRLGRQKQFKATILPGFTYDGSLPWYERAHRIKALRSKVLAQTRKRSAFAETYIINRWFFKKPIPDDLKRILSPEAIDTLNQITEIETDPMIVKLIEYTMTYDRMDLARWISADLH